LAALALVVGVLANPHSADGVHLYQTVGYSGLAVACAAVVARAVTAVPPPVLTFRPLRWVGRLSYGVYLWHYPIMTTMHQHGLSDWLALVVGGGLSVAAAAVSWQLVEQPAQRWHRRRASGRDREVVEPSSVVVPGDVKAVLRRG
jgi:peptidoglycan/LPS O-acetylase OafA/YrhL